MPKTLHTNLNIHLVAQVGTSDTSEFESHWVPHSYGLVSHLSKKYSKLLPNGTSEIW